jgi:hypothetical protein
MAFPSRPLYVTWGGQFGAAGSASDVWQCGLHFGMASNAQPDLPTTAELQTLYNGPIANFHNNANTGINLGAKLMWAKAVILTEAGKYATEPVIYSGATVPGGVDAGDGGGSPSSSLVISLRSGQKLGTGNYGRFYLPWFARGAWPDTGRLTDSVRAAVLARAVEFVNDAVAWVHAASGADNGLRIFSSAGGGSKKLVTTVAVGDVVDAQLRRRNKARESYAATAITNP